MKVLVIPDCQVRKGVDTSYLDWIGRYAAYKKPDVIVQIGDFADMPSLSSHDKAGSKSMEGKRYKEDIQYTQEAMSRLMHPIREEQRLLKKNHKPQWKPKLVLTLGNHENRIDRAINNDPKLDGLISTSDLAYTEFGWTVIPFLEPIEIGGVMFCHYFVSGVMGRPVTSARALLTKHHQSCFAGHQQGRDVAYSHRANGDEMTAILCGSAYLHDEDYLNHQTNNHWRGVYMLHNVHNGSFDEMPVSLQYLRSKYEW